MSERLENNHLIRAATTDDHQAVDTLLKSCYPVLMKPYYNPAVLETALPRMTRANPVLLNSGSFFVAECTNGDIVGCGGWTRERPGNGEVIVQLGHIRHFATHPEHAGLGIGRSLYKACVQQARAAGISRFECYASLNAEGFYAALGFEKLKEISVDLGDRTTLPGVLMALAI